MLLLLLLVIWLCIELCCGLRVVVCVGLCIGDLTWSRRGRVAGGPALRRASVSLQFARPPSRIPQAVAQFGNVDVYTSSFRPMRNTIRWAVFSCCCFPRALLPWRHCCTFSFRPVRTTIWWVADWLARGWVVGWAAGPTAASWCFGPGG